MRLRLFYITLLSSGIAFSQTNIDTTLFSPKWAETDLNATQFQNGETLLCVTNQELWDYALKNDLPAYTVIKHQGKQSYLYNWYALVDKRKIAPSGYSIPNKSDLELLDRNKYYQSETGWEDYSWQNYFNAPATGYFGSDSFDLLSQGYVAYYWTIDRAKALVSTAFAIQTNEIGFSELELKRESFCLVRCIRKPLENIEETNLPYSTLLPYVHDDFISQIKKEIENNYFPVLTTNKDNQELKINIHFNENGKNQSEIETTINSFMVKRNLMDLLESDLIAPRYNGKTLKCKDELDLSFETTIFPTGTSKDPAIHAESTPDHIKNTFENIGFIGQIQRKSLNFKVNEDIWNSHYLSSVKARGPGFASLSLIPGLGSKMVSRGKEKMKYLLAASCPILIIGTFSKLYSNFAYANYLREPYGNNALYERANFTHKTFIVTTLLYGGLMSADLVWTIKTGIKNKTNQKKVNKYLQEQTPLGLRIR